MSLEEKVIEAVAKVAKRKTGEVRLESSFDDLGMDSLDRVCLLFELEQAFDISIPETEAQGIQTVQDIITRLGPHLAPRRGRLFPEPRRRPLRLAAHPDPPARGRQPAELPHRPRSSRLRAAAAFHRKRAGPARPLP